MALDGRFENADEAYVFTATDDGVPAYHVVTPFVLDDGRVLFVDRGIVPPALRNPQTRAASLLEGEQHVVGVWRTPDAPGLFTPAPDLTHRVWYSRDVAGHGEDAARSSPQRPSSSKPTRRRCPADGPKAGRQSSLCPTITCNMRSPGSCWRRALSSSISPIIGRRDG